MAKGTPVDSDLLRQIPDLRKQGLSFYKIADILGIAESTVRKYQNNAPTMRFTKRQIEIAIAAAQKNARK